MQLNGDLLSCVIQCSNTEKVTMDANDTITIPEWTNSNPNLQTTLSEEVHECTAKNSRNNSESECLIARQGHWICRVCTLENANKCKTCDACGISKRLSQGTHSFSESLFSGIIQTTPELNQSKARNRLKPSSFPLYPRRVSRVGDEYQVHDSMFPEFREYNRDYQQEILAPSSTELSIPLLPDQVDFSSRAVLEDCEGDRDLYELLWLPANDDVKVPKGLSNDQLIGDVVSIVDASIDNRSNEDCIEDYLARYLHCKMQALQTLFQNNYHIESAIAAMQSLKYFRFVTEPPLLDENERAIFRDAMSSNYEDWSLIKHALGDKYSISQLQDYYLMWSVDTKYAEEKSKVDIKWKVLSRTKATKASKEAITNSNHESVAPKRRQSTVKSSLDTIGPFDTVLSPTEVDETHDRMQKENGDIESAKGDFYADNLVIQQNNQHRNTAIDTESTSGIKEIGPDRSHVCIPDKKSSTKLGVETLEWDCLLCTFKNKMTLRKCELCNTRKPQLKNKKSISCPSESKSNLHIQGGAIQNLGESARNVSSGLRMVDVHEDFVGSVGKEIDTTVRPNKVKRPNLSNEESASTNVESARRKKVAKLTSSNSNGDVTHNLIKNIDTYRPAQQRNSLFSRSSCDSYKNSDGDCVDDFDSGHINNTNSTVGVHEIGIINLKHENEKFSNSSRFTAIWDSKNNDFGEEEQEKEVQSEEDEDIESEEKIEDQQIAQPGHWICRVCTLENINRARVCNACGVAKTLSLGNHRLSADIFAGMIWYPNDEQSSNGKAPRKKKPKVPENCRKFPKIGPQFQVDESSIPDCANWDRRKYIEDTMSGNELGDGNELSDANLDVENRYWLPLWHDEDSITEYKRSDVLYREELVQGDVAIFTDDVPKVDKDFEIEKSCNCQRLVSIKNRDCSNEPIHSQFTTRFDPKGHGFMSDDLSDPMPPERPLLDELKSEIVAASIPGRSIAVISASISKENISNLKYNSPDKSKTSILDRYLSLFPHAAVQALQTLVKSEYDVAAAIDCMRQLTLSNDVKFTTSTQILSDIDREQFSKMMATHWEDWSAIKRSLDYRFSVSQLQDYYYVVWSLKYRNEMDAAQRTYENTCRKKAIKAQRAAKAAAKEAAKEAKRLERLAIKESLAATESSLSKSAELIFNFVSTENSEKITDPVSFTEDNPTLL